MPILIIGCRKIAGNCDRHSNSTLFLVKVTDVVVFTNCIFSAMADLSPLQISVVLVEPTQPGNIGATARAMDNMGVTDLRLVNPCHYFHPEARMFAMNARHLLHKAHKYPSLQEAIEDRQLIIGTSARQRDKIQKSTSIFELPELLRYYSPRVKIALVFGTERSGLTNEDMSLCNEWIHIPTFTVNGSLNLAQAVMVVLYELSKAYGNDVFSQETSLKPASSEKIEGMKKHFFQVLEQIKFLRHGAKDSIWHSFASLIGRAKPDERDIRMMRGFFNRIEVTLKRQSNAKKADDEV